MNNIAVTITVEEVSEQLIKSLSILSHYLQMSDFGSVEFKHGIEHAIWSITTDFNNWIEDKINEAAIKESHAQKEVPSAP